MSSAQTSLGGVVSLEYGFSTDFQNEPGVGPQVLLTSLTTDDGRVGTATTTYTYSGGATNREARRSLGYETIRQDLPCIAGETQCPWIETQFRQDLPAVGRPSRVERRAGNGALLTATDYAYTTVDAASLRKALLTEVTAYEFDGSGVECTTWPCANGKWSQIVDAATIPLNFLGAVVTGHPAAWASFQSALWLSTKVSWPTPKPRPYCGIEGCNKGRDRQRGRR